MKKGLMQMKMIRLFHSFSIYLLGCRLQMRFDSKCERQPEINTRQTVKMKITTKYVDLIYWKFNNALNENRYGIK